MSLCVSTISTCVNSTMNGGVLCEHSTGMCFAYPVVRKQGGGGGGGASSAGELHKP